MATMLGRTPQWWDRDIDRTGRPLRHDVRKAALEIWQEACRRARFLLGDDSDAAELLEIAVGHVSRYLNRADTPLGARDCRPLLLLNFSQELRRRVRKLRLNPSPPEPDGGKDRAAPDWIANVERKLDLEKLLSYLSPRSCRTIALKSMGYTWTEIGNVLKISASTARNSFWTDIRQVQFKLSSRQRQKNKGY
jgi:hypothetical protein